MSCRALLLWNAAVLLLWTLGCVDKTARRDDGVDGGPNLGDEDAGMSVDGSAGWTPSHRLRSTPTAGGGSDETGACEVGECGNDGGRDAIAEESTDAGGEAACIHPALAGCDLTGRDLRGESLAESDLQGADLTGAKLAGADLRGADMTSATLAGADLRGADLRGARLVDADLRGADLEGADLGDVDLGGARLDGSHSVRLSGCPASNPSSAYRCVENYLLERHLVGPQLDLSRANLVGADLSHLDLTGADLYGTEISGTYDGYLDGLHAVELLRCPAQLPIYRGSLWQCLLQPGTGRFVLVGLHADVSGTDLAGIDFSGLTARDLERMRATDLLGCPESLPTSWSCLRQHESESPYVLVGPTADLRGVDLVEAQLSHAHLSGVDFEGADLRGANLSFASLSSANLVRAALDGAALVSATLVDAGLRFSSLADADLTDAVLEYVTAYDLVACPAVLPPAYGCIAQGSGAFALVGPAVHLGGADLAGADLGGLNLNFADLNGADLTGADLGNSSLVDAYVGAVVGCPAVMPNEWRCVPHATDRFSALLGERAITRAAFGAARVSLANLDLRGMKLSGINLLDAQLSDIDLSHADLTNASLSSAQLLGVNLADADLRGADLTRIFAEAVDLRGADLAGATLASASLRGALFDLRSCPAQLPGPGWRCVEQPAVGRYALLGPGVALAGADLGGARFDAVDLSQGSLSGADLSGADLSGVMLAEAAVMGLLGCPSVLPDARWRCVTTADGSFVLLGPGVSIDDVDLHGADLDGVDLSDAWVGRGDLRDTSLRGAVLSGTHLWTCDLRGADLSTTDLLGTGLIYTRAHDLRACPARVPEGFRCIAQPNGHFAVLGLSGRIEADLRGCDLAGLDLRHADLRGSDLTAASLADVRLEDANTTQLLSCPAALPSTAFRCIAQANGRHVLAGPGTYLGTSEAGVDYTGADFTGADLSSARLWHARTYPIAACPAVLPSALFACVELAGGSFALVGDDVDLIDAPLAGADLHDLSLSGTRLDGADLRGADLRGTFLYQATLEGTLVTSAITDMRTTCPQGGPGPCW